MGKTSVKTVSKSKNVHRSLFHETLCERMVLYTLFACIWKCDMIIFLCIQNIWFVFVSLVELQGKIPEFIRTLLEMRKYYVLYIHIINALYARCSKRMWTFLSWQMHKLADDIISADVMSVRPM